MNHKTRVRSKARLKRQAKRQAERDAAFEIDIDTPKDFRIIKKDTKKFALVGCVRSKTHGSMYRKFLGRGGEL
jgi:hypothetical protein